MWCLLIVAFVQKSQMELHCLHLSIIHISGYTLMLKSLAIPNPSLYSPSSFDLLLLLNLEWQRQMLYNHVWFGH